MSRSWRRQRGIYALIVVVRHMHGSLFLSERWLAAAPRTPQLIVPACSPPPSIHQIEAAAKPVYGMYGTDAAKGFRNVIHPDLGHVYTPQM